MHVTKRANTSIPLCFSLRNDQKKLYLFWYIRTDGKHMRVYIDEATGTLTRYRHDCGKHKLVEHILKDFGTFPIDTFFLPTFTNEAKYARQKSLMWYLKEAGL